MILPVTPVSPGFVATNPDITNPLYGGMSGWGLGQDDEGGDTGLDTGTDTGVDTTTTLTSTGGFISTSTTGTALPTVTSTDVQSDLTAAGLTDAEAVNLLVSGSTSGCGPNANGSIQCGSQTIPSTYVSAYASFPTVTTGYYFDAAGNIIVPYANGGGYYTITPGGTLVQNNTTPPTSSGSYSSNPSAATAAQAAAITSAITQAGKVAQILALQPGQSLLPNGTVVGAGVSTSALSSLLGGTSSSTIMIFGVAFIGLILLEAGKR